MPQRNHPRSPSTRCPVQARPGYADQYQEARQFGRPRRRPQQAQDHSAGNLSLISIVDFNPIRFGNDRFLEDEFEKAWNHSAARTEFDYSVNLFIGSCN